MTTQQLKEHKRYTFEVFCKTVLRNKARNIHKKLNRMEQSEVLFADIPTALEAMLGWEDDYHLTESISIKSKGNEFVVENEALAGALTILLPKYKEILFFELLFRVQRPKNRTYAWNITQHGYNPKSQCDKTPQRTNEV